MKHLKTFEREIVNTELLKALEYFFSQYNIFISKYQDYPLNRAKTYNIPEFLYDDFSILYFLYEYRGWWSNNYNISADFVKREIKTQTLNSIINKFNEDSNKYFILKDIFDKNPKWNDARSLHGVSGGTVKYIFMLLYRAVNKAPQWIKDSNKFNL